MFALLFSWYSFQGDFLIALVYFSGFLVTSLLFASDQNWSKKIYSISSQVVFTVYTLASLLLILLIDQQDFSLHLSLLLVYPLLALSLLPFIRAVFFIVVFSVAVNLLLMLQLEGAFRAIYLTTFWLVTLLTTLHRLAHINYREKLKKQLNHDVKTQLLNKNQFLFDLHKEQERAQREAISLGIIYIVNEKNFDLRTAKEVASYFAAYEGIYSLEKNKLVALLPLAKVKELKEKEDQLAKALPSLSFESQLITEESLTLGNLPTAAKKLEAKL
ncbi:MAG: hypothetical protein GX029_01585 [Pseudomonadaceae bacterium]|nr:hypothetical protein [Pseudomonadaceae bacterium]